jgi:predicted nucleotidyltransferase
MAVFMPPTCSLELSLLHAQPSNQRIIDNEFHNTPSLALPLKAHRGVTTSILDESQDIDSDIICIIYNGTNLLLISYIPDLIQENCVKELFRPS